MMNWSDHEKESLDDDEDERMAERCFWRRIGFLIFGIIAAAFLIFGLYGCASVEGPKSIYDGPPMSIRKVDGDYVRLTKEPCPNVRGWLGMSKAEMVYQGKPYEACWVKIFSTFLIFDSNGDMTPIPAAAFQEEIGA